MLPPHRLLLAVHDRPQPATRELAAQLRVQTALPWAPGAHPESGRVDVVHEDDARRLLGHPAARLRRDDAPVDDGRIRGPRTLRGLLENEPGNHALVRHEDRGEAFPRALPHRL